VELEPVLAPESELWWGMVLELWLELVSELSLGMGWELVLELS
jgi:hypothetical protein